MANILEYNHHYDSSTNGGQVKWRGWETVVKTNYNYFGPYNGKRHMRMVARVKLNTLAANFDRNQLTITININMKKIDGVTFNTNEKFVAAITDSFNGGSWEQPTASWASSQSETQFSVSPGCSEGNNTITWTISKDDFSKIPKSVTTIYIYFYSGLPASGSYNNGSITSIAVSETSVKIYDKVITGAVTTGSAYYKPGQSITASWGDCLSSGTNAVQSIKAYYKIGSTPTSSDPGNLISSTLSASDTSTKFTLPNDSSRGSDIYIAIQAIGNKSGFDGDLKYDKIGSVNRLPNDPIISQTGDSVAGSNTVNFAITKGSDDDSQTTSIYYKLNNGDRQALSGTTLTISVTDTISGIKSGDNTIYFYTYDGLEDSSPASATFEVLYAPVLNNATIDYSDYLVKNGYNNTTTLAKGGIISYILARDVTNPFPIFELRTSSTSSGLSSAAYSQKELEYSMSSSTKKITLDFIESANITAGHYFQIRMAIQDDYGTSNFIELDPGQKPAKPVEVSSVTLKCDGNNDAPSNYFNNKVIISFKNPASSTSRPDIVSIKIFADKTEFPCTDVAEGANPRVELDLSEKARNTTVNFSVQLMDAAGQMATSEISTELTRIPELKFEGPEWQVNPSTFKPYTYSVGLTLNHPEATTKGVSQTITYLYKLDLNGIPKSLNSNNITATAFKDLVNEIIPEAERNASYTGVITITATDTFGQSTQLSQQNIIIDYIEKPTFPNPNKIKIRHNQYINSIDINTATEITTGMAQDAAARRFSPEEKIILMLPRATDFNNDITKYNIYISRNSIPDTSTVPKLSDAVIYEESPWLSLTPSQLTIFDEDYFYYCHSASQYSDNKYYYFKLVVEDSKGNKTEPRDSNTYIIGCRATKPTFSTGLINSTRTTDKTQVTINYKDFLITDLGGSAPASGWNFNYYNKYPNITKATLLIEISPDASFSGQIKSKPLEIDLSTLKIKNNVKETTFSDVSSWSKIYIRFTVTIEYAKIDSTTSKTIISEPFIDSYMGDVPTVSHRSHWVGINTNIPNSGEVFVVESYSGNKKIVLRYASNGKTITIDLETLTIDGATIDGGTWG